MKNKPQQISLGQILGKSSAELACSVRDCTELQWVISRLLEKSQHPDLVTEMHVLQDIDRLQQTLADLACLLDTISSEVPELAVDMASAQNAMRLASLRARVFESGDIEDVPVTESRTANDVTWL